MPEGPEIYYLKELLKKKIKKHVFKKIVSNTKSIVELPEESEVKNIGCKGKVFWIETEKYYVHLHMMITGWLVFEKPKIYKYELEFDNTTIYIEDRRRFSKLTIVNSKEEHDKIINDLGMDFLKNEITLDEFKNTLEKSKKKIGEILLDQKIFCGVGNYIRNEALYLANINPKIKCQKLSNMEIKILYEKLKFVIFSNLHEMLNNAKIKIPKEIKDISPDNMEIPYKYKVYDREKDDMGNIIKKEKLGGRWIYYI